jgi:hypothetical protein
VGRKNANLIKVAERFRSTVGVDHPAYKIAEQAVNESQEKCPHLGEIREFSAKKDSPRGRFKKGDLVKFCVDCALPLKVEEAQ